MGKWTIAWNGFQILPLLIPSEQLTELFTCRIRRRFQRGLKRKPLALIKRLRKAKKEAPALEKPEVSCTVSLVRVVGIRPHSFIVTNHLDNVWSDVFRLNYIIANNLQSHVAKYMNFDISTLSQFMLINIFSSFSVAWIYKWLALQFGAFNMQLYLY